MAIEVSTLTEATLEGTGIFDVLMRANKAHLDAEFAKGRIKGSEYATVYLGSLQSVMNTALGFLTQGEKLSLEAQLLEQQILLAQVEVQKAQAELAILQADLARIPAQIAQIESQTALTDAQVALTNEQAANAVVEGTVLQAQKCKLDAEYDVLLIQKLKTSEEQALLAQKRLTEAAQTTALGVDADSVIGRQKGLYVAQTNGFSRDAEQKAADLMAKTWMTRRTTDDGTVADATNMLDDASIGRAINKLLQGVGA